MNVYKKLLNIQSELNCPKDLFNKFGNYSYRSAETILESLKPLLKANGTIVNISDKLVLIGDRYYVEATATLIDVDTGERVEAKALAREEESKKGMDGSQITGSASSYARKYALNGLFLIDATKDADTDEYKRTTSKDTLTCPKCGKAIKDYRKADGTVTPAKVVFDSCGGMCLECYKKNGG